MKLWQSMTVFKVVMVALNGWAQEVNLVGQLNKLRNLPEQSQDLMEKPALDPAGSPWAFYLGSGLTYTTNANLTSSDAADDLYATSTLGVRRQTTLAQGVALSSGIEVTDYRHERYPRLSVSFLDWDVMLSWSGRTSTLQWQGYVSHTLEGTQQGLRGAQSISSIAALGGSVTRKIAPRHEISAAAEISVTPYTWPSANAYGCASLSAAYNWKVTPGIGLNHSIRGYETLYFMGRSDFTTSYTATLNWALTSWLSASLFASPSWNFSSQRGGDYSAVDIGTTVSGNWQF